MERMALTWADFIISRISLIKVLLSFIFHLIQFNWMYKFEKFPYLFMAPAFEQWWVGWRVKDVFS
jgi:hypothetical protein